MKLKNLKKGHALILISVLYFLTCPLTGNYVFFPFACCFLGLGMASLLKESDRFASSAQTEKERMDKPSAR